jgi:hypothetical protein
MNNLGIKYTVEKLNHYLELVNQKKISYPVEQKDLNYLHSKFVKEKFKNEKIWSMINLLIHSLENIKEDPFLEHNCSIHFVKDPDPQLTEIKEEHKLWITTEHKWGDLILGYGTLGKDWLEIYKGNDSMDELVLQSTINSETCIFFHVENPYRKFDEKNFYPWAVNNNVNLDNLNNLSFGRYILGQIIITDDFLSFHPTVSDWYVPNHICKLKWNKEFVRSDTEITSIEFFDSDMYYESIINHSKFSTLYETN